MTNHKKTILSLLERVEKFHAEGKIFSAIHCLSQAVGLIAQTIEDPKPQASDVEVGDPWPKVHADIDKEAFKRNLTDMDIMVIFQLGLAAWDAAKKWGAKFPHE